MDKNYIDYVVKVERLIIPNDIEEIRINSIYDGIEEIVLSQDKNELNQYITQIRFYLADNVESINEAKEIINLALDNILNKIAYELSSCIGNAELKKVKLNNKRVTKGSLSRIGTMAVSTGEDLLNNLKEILESDIEQSVYLELYSAALKDKNKVVRYMFLYNILLQIYDDSQKKVDDFIKDELGENEADFTQSPIRNFKETKFTRLRNEIAHKRQNTNFKNTKKEIINNVEQLMKLVKIAIEQEN